MSVIDAPSGVSTTQEMCGPMNATSSTCAETVVRPAPSGAMSTDSGRTMSATCCPSDRPGTPADGIVPRPGTSTA